jgi:hypothetical protein
MWSHSGRCGEVAGEPTRGSDRGLHTPLSNFPVTFHRHVPPYKHAHAHVRTGMHREVPIIEQSSRANGRGDIRYSAAGEQAPHG